MTKQQTRLRKEDCANKLLVNPMPEPVTATQSPVFHSLLAVKRLLQPVPRTTI